MKFLTLMLVFATILGISGCAKNGGGVNSGAAAGTEAQDLETRFAQGVTVVYFYSTSCAQCTAQDKENPQIISDLEKLRVTYVKIHPNRATISKYGLTKFPTLIVLKNGREFHRWTGIVYPDMMMLAVKRALGQ